MSASKADLLQCEDGCKDRLHQHKNKVSEHIAKQEKEIDNHKTEVALLKQSHKFMKSEVTEIKTLLKDFIASVDKKYATKEEHKDNLKHIDKLTEKVRGVEDWKVKIITMATIGATVGGFILNKVF